MCGFLAILALPANGPNLRSLFLLLLLTGCPGDVLQLFFDPQDVVHSVNTWLDSQVQSWGVCFGCLLTRPSMHHRLLEPYPPLQPCRVLPYPQNAVLPPSQVRSPVALG
jgi:hypothetical protein